MGKKHVIDPCSLRPAGTWVRGCVRAGMKRHSILRVGGARSRAREVFGVRQDGETWFSPRMHADISAALVETDENWKTRPGYCLRVSPWGEASSMVPEISSTGAVKWRSVILMTDSRVFLTRLRIFSYSISSSVLF